MEVTPSTIFVDFHQMAGDMLRKKYPNNRFTSPQESIFSGNEISPNRNIVCIYPHFVVVSPRVGRCSDSLVNSLNSMVLEVLLTKQSDISFEGSLITAAELDVLRLLCRGMSNKLIAQIRGTKKRTVDTQISALISKSDTNNRVQLAVWAIKNNLVNLDDI